VRIRLSPLPREHRLRARALLVLGIACLAIAPGMAAAKSTNISFVSVQVRTHGTKPALAENVDYQGKKRIGHDTLTCTIVNARLAHCTMAVTLAKGTINARLDLKRSSDDGPITITGGTGSYAGAKGTGKYRILNDTGTRTAVALHLK
jgi:hypothetical protein